MDEPEAAVVGRARGAMYGLAIGDALGMPTQLRSRRWIVNHYGELLGDFLAGPHDHPIAADIPAGTVTDDTEQAVLIGRLLVAGGGHVDADTVAQGLVAWEREVEARGSLDLLGPSSRAAIAAIAAGAPPDAAGRHGTTNGAAMRIAPVGIATPPGVGPGRWVALVDQVVAVSKVTHNTGVALAGAAAIAAAVSAGVDGADLVGARRAAVEAAHLAAGRGHWVAGADVAARLDWATRLVAGIELKAAMEAIVTLVGTSLASQESVPAAFAVVAAVPDDPWLAVRVAASLGGDTDTIAAMVGAMTGAIFGVDAWPATARRTVDANGLHLPELADELLRLRAEPSRSPRTPPSAVEALGRRALSGPLTPVVGVAGEAPPASAAATTGEGRPAPVPRLIFVGEAVVDVTAWIPSPPPRGGDVVATAAAMTPGGGFNVMAAAARQGMVVLYAGRHGAGPAGESVRRALGAEGIAALRPLDPEADTGFVVTTIEPDGERTFVTSPAALMAAGPDDLAAVPVRPGDVAYVSGYGLASRSGGDLVRWLVALDPAVTVVADPGPLAADIDPGRLTAALARIDWWSCNRREAALVTGLDDPGRAAVELAARRPSGGVIVRIGAGGCLLVDRARPHATAVSVPAPAVEVVDTTGAGDTHVGVFVAGLAAGLTPLGPATAPTGADIDQWMGNHGGGVGR
jgi:ADP-ribosylglycohydrolase/sugar/nucleoside kinase (ribokinase family)